MPLTDDVTAFPAVAIKILLPLGDSEGVVTVNRDTKSTIKRDVPVEPLMYPFLAIDVILSSVCEQLALFDAE